MVRVTLGLVAEVTLVGKTAKNVMARMDTGATASSIDIELAKELGLEPSSKTKVVKSASGIKRRPMVRAKVILRDQEIEDEFTLADRSQLSYQVLVGQNILKKGNFLIDPNK
jgi:hypothetical protein